MGEFTTSGAKFELQKKKKKSLEMQDCVDGWGKGPYDSYSMSCTPVTAYKFIFLSKIKVAL